jgi:NAD(P)-dependent dehydrogenase (short-subunit alcohol dehydrogenase family)
MSMPDFSLDGRVALLTGAGRGIGLAIARAFAAAGGAVMIQDIEPEVAEAEAESLRRRGARAAAIGGDIGDPELPKMLVDRTIEQLGGLHILVNNAAI